MSDMLDSLKREANKTYTENGAVTYESTLCACLDYFAMIGGMRYEEEKGIIELFMRAFAEDRLLAMKLLFYTRDIRGGIGERRIFRCLLRWLAYNHSEYVTKNIGNIPEFGRYDDLIALLGTPCEQAAAEFMASVLRSDIEAMKNGGEVSLLAKWLPSANASSEKTIANAKRTAKLLGMKLSEYRRTLSSLRSYIRIIENDLSRRDYTFDYSKQPSKAMLKYRKAFLRNDEERYTEYLKAVSKGDAKLNTAALAPYEVISPLFSADWCYNLTIDSMSDKEKAALDTTWNSLEDFTNGENAIAVVDGSGSMYGTRGAVEPIKVALSLGIYFAERNNGAFANHFITFSENPKLVEIKGRDIAEKVRYCTSYNEMANTNIQKVFELILGAAVKNGMTQSDLPSTVYIISDMEFDDCTADAQLTNFGYAKQLFEEHGYKLPQLVFWNVESHRRNVPVEKNEQGVILVSGVSPRIFAMVKSKNYDPYTFMFDVICSERYDCIKA